MSVHLGTDHSPISSSGSFFQLWVHLPIRFRRQEGVAHRLFVALSLLGVFMPGGDYGFAIDCPSHVRVRPRFHVKTILGNQILTNTASIAICNRNKVVVTLTFIVWGASIGFHLHSKFLPLAPVEDL